MLQWKTCAVQQIPKDIANVFAKPAPLKWEKPKATNVLVIRDQRIQIQNKLHDQESPDIKQRTNAKKLKITIDLHVFLMLLLFFNSVIDVRDFI